jgi:hypothetical protein
MTRQKTDFIQLRLADDRPIVIQARRRWWWWWLFLDSRMLSALNEMGRQVRITEAALLLARRGSFRRRLNGHHFSRDRCFCLASVFLSGFYFFFFCCGSFFLFQVLVLHCSTIVISAAGLSGNCLRTRNFCFHYSQNAATHAFQSRGIDINPIQPFRGCTQIQFLVQPHGKIVGI